MKESPEKRLENITFFVDRSSGKQLAEGLKELGLNVKKHDDHFKQDTLDIVWLEECGKNDWVVVSSDKAIKKNPLERQALMQNSVAAFFFTSANISSAEQIEGFKKGLNQIAKIISNEKRPFIARIDKEGKVEIWLNHSGEDVIAKKQAERRMKS